MDMDQFNIPHQKVKEKSVYLLHLDAARIILISAAVIGIIIVSFLLGMNFIKGGDGTRSLVGKNDIFEGQKELDLLKNNIPDLPDEEDLSKPMDEKLLNSDKDEKDSIKDKTEPDSHAVTKEKKADVPSISKNDSPDLLTRDNFDEEVIPGKESRKTSARYSNDAKKISRSPKRDMYDKPVKKATVKNDVRKKKRGKSKVVAVSGDRVDERKNVSSGNYVIQVASFDKKSKAQSEIKALKDLNYDAFLDESQVRGRQYFRVRVGPVASRKRAIDLLKNIQENDKYQESYMVRE